jgi:predicted MFS family arabinose efflux permease
MRARHPLPALIAANAVSLVGNVLATVAVPWFVLETTGSAAKTGIAAFFTTLPLAFGALFGGTIADRVGHRFASVSTDLASAAAISAVPAPVQPLPARVLASRASRLRDLALRRAGSSAREALVPQLAEQSGRSLERATSLWVSTEHIAYVIGAPTAGLLIAAFGSANVLWIDAATFVLAALLVAFGVRGGAHVHATTARRYLDELREGIRFLLDDSVLRFFLVAATVGNMLAAPIAFVFLPVYAKDVVGSSLALGLCVAAYGLGGIGGAILLEPVVRLFGRTRAYLFSWVIWVVVYFALAALPPLPVMVAILLATGVSVAAPIEALIRHERTPPYLRARVFATYMAALTLAAPIGALAAGFLVETVGLRTAIVALAIMNAVGAVVFVRPAARSVQAATSAA